MEVYPGNSHKKRTTTEKEEPKKIEKVITGAVVTRKKTLIRRFTETFLGEDVGSVSSYLIQDVFIPAAKSTMYEMVRGGFEMLIFGEAKDGSHSRRERGSRVSYDKISYRDERRDMSPRNRARHNFDDVVIESRTEADDVINCLVDLIEDYGFASVADLYDLVGITPNFTDNKYGWDNLRSAKPERVRDGYRLDLPRPTLLD